MPTRIALHTVAVAMVSGAAGWWLAAPVDMPAAPPAIQAASRPQPLQPTRPQVVVLDDGNVTLRVEREPLEWVLSEIARQGGHAELQASGLVRSSAPTLRPAMPSANASDSCSTTPSVQAPDADRLLQAVRHGTEADRSAGLLEARNAGMALPDTTLKQLYETDASAEVRLLAFEAYLESRGADSTALRAALQAGLYVPHAVIQHEAQRRLDELAEAERIAAASPQTGP